MDLKILFLILSYYGILSIFILGAGPALSDTTLAGGINSSSIQPDEVTTGGIFGTGISFTRFIGLLTIGVGMPSDTPAWVVTPIIVWQSMFTVLTIGWFVSSIWNG